MVNNSNKKKENVMKSIMKKIAMMGMLSCMASLNTYTSDSQLESHISSLSKTFATIPHDPKLNTEYKALTSAIADLLAPLKTGGTIDTNKKKSVYDQFMKFQHDLHSDSQYQTYAKSHQFIIHDLYEDEIIDDKPEYSIVPNTFVSWQSQYEDEIIDDLQDKAYAGANPSTITTLNDSISKVMNPLKNIDRSSWPKNLMTEPTHETPVQQVNIMVSNLPANTFIAAGVLYHHHGKTNYSIQTPNADGSYTFHTSHSYAAAANNRQSFINQHKGTDFLGKTKWDVTADIIS